MTSVFNDGNDVGTCLGNVEEVTTGTVREFNGVDCSFGSDNVGNVGDGGSCSCSEVENFGAWFDPNIVDTTENGSSDCSWRRNQKLETIQYITKLHERKEYITHQYLFSLLDLKGFQTLYSTLVVFPSGPGGVSTLILFSPYTATPGVELRVTSASSFPRAMNTPS